MSALEIVRRNGDAFTVQYDDADHAAIAAHRWRISPQRGEGRYYVITTVRRDGRETTVSMHQLICGKGADHINGDGLDNRRANLRPATPAQNAANRRAVRSGLKGVTFHKKSGRWQAAIAKRYLGLFATEAEAGAAYDRAAVERWGEFARLNGAAS